MFTDTKEIRIETSTICNYNCIVCPRDSFKRKKEAMQNELFDKILEKTAKELDGVRFLTISGFGELATDPQWRYKIKRGAENFDKLHVITNGSLLSFADLDYILEYAMDLRISVYGASEEVYNAVHRPKGNAGYKAIEEKIAYLCKRRKPDQRILLNYLEVEENSGETQKWIEIWKDRADLIEVWRPHNWINGKNFRTICSHRLKTCGRPFHGPIQVQADGTVNVCCFDYNGELVIGDLKTESFEEIFSGEAMERIQNLHRRNEADSMSQCSICDQRDCIDCKSTQLLYDSGFDPKKRVSLTSTEYENMTRRKQ